MTMYGLSSAAWSSDGNLSLPAWSRGDNVWFFFCCLEQEWQFAFSFFPVPGAEMTFYDVSSDT